MSLFDSLGAKQAPQTGINPLQMLNELRANPAAVLKQAGYNVPDNLNNPQQIINHLMQSGQITNQRLRMVQQMAGRMGR